MTLNYSQEKRLSAIGAHLNAEQDFAIRYALKALPRGDSLETYINLGLHKLGLREPIEQSHKDTSHPRVTSPLVFVTSASNAERKNKFLYWTI